MSFIHPKNESPLSLQLYFFVIGLFIFVNAVTLDYTVVPSMKLFTTVDVSLTLLQIVIALGFIYTALTLKKYLQPSKVKFLKVELVAAFILMIPLSISASSIDYISIVISALITWYLYASVDRLSKKV